MCFFARWSNVYEKMYHGNKAGWIPALQHVIPCGLQLAAYADMPSKFAMPGEWKAMVEHLGRLA